MLVADIQTKRMVQRRGSTSSQGSANGISRRPGELQRQNSSGSMTERTFRSPSPNRASELVQHDQDAPPVPALPPSYMYPPAIPAKSHRRAASVEPPERVSSPPPKILGGRGVSLDRGPGVMKGRPMKQTGNRVTSLSSIGELERTESRGSINFSRPMSPQNSPPTSPVSDKRPKSLTTNLAQSSQEPQQKMSVGPLRNGEVDAIQNSLQQAARPTKKKKKMVDKASAEGSHLAAGSMGVRRPGAASNTPERRVSTASPTPTASNESQASNSIDASASVPKKKTKVVPIANNSQTQESSRTTLTGYASDSDSVSERSPSTEPPRGFHTRTAGLLTKQPSTVREEREAEEQEERTIYATADSTMAQKDSANTGTASTNSSRKLAESKQHTRSTSQPTSIDRAVPTTPIMPSLISENADSKGNNRPQSLSPARTARFSSRPTIMTPDGVRHQPPPRSVSPAKSALKSSPSSRGPSPAGDTPSGWSRKAPSEASDTTSLVSDDGVRSMPKKKNVRVSFDSEPAVFGRAVSPPSTPDSPVFATTQNRDSKKIGPGIGRDRDKKQGSGSSIAEVDNAIVPRPALPSFGSVRGRKDQNDPTAKSDTTSGTSWAKETLSRLDISTDQAVGAVLVQDAENRNSASAIAGTATLNKSLLKGSDRGPKDEIGDARSRVTVKEAPSANENNHHDIETNRSPESNDEVPTTEHHGTVPSIAVQPATPGVEESLHAQEEWLGMPGGFPVPQEDSGRTESSPSHIAEHHPTDLTPAAIGIAEPEPEAAAANHNPASPAVGDVAEALRGQTVLKDLHEESEDDNDSIYSDAAEDLSDLDGDGFGSINAIVESPASRSPGIAITTPPDSPIFPAPNTKRKESAPLSNNHNEPVQPSSSEGWDQAQAYWSGLSQSRKEQLERAAAPSAFTKIPNSQPAPKPKKKKIVSKTEPQAQTSAHPPLPPWPDKKSREEVQRPESPKVPAMKSSMRKSQRQEAEEPHIRLTMRKSQQYEAEESHIRSTMRNAAPTKSSMRPTSPLPKQTSPPEPRGALQKKHRPMSAAAMVDYNQASLPMTTKHGRAVSEGFQPKALTPIAAQPAKKTSAANIRRTKSNDSDSSSSFKKARTTTTDAGRYTMKRTMRAASVDERPRSTYEDRSKAFSVRPLSPVDSIARRPFSPGGPGFRTSMRGSFDSRAKSPTHNFGFGTAPKPKKDTKIKSPGSSRFDDSSDEEGGPKTFSSRFVDSSDEEDPAPLPSDLTPVRGIPKRLDEGDSTDLEDSSVETSPRLPRSPKTPKTLEGAALASGSLRHNGLDVDSPKNTDMGTGLQAKKAAEKEKEKKRRTFLSPFGSKRREESTMRKTEVASAPAPAAPLESRKAERIMDIDSPQQSPRSPKLQRRNTPKRLTADAWPLPQNPATATANVRPKTSDGTTTAKSRPDIGFRRTTMEGQPALVTNGTAIGKGGKKKRFGMLRKAFGLHD